MVATIKLHHRSRRSYAMMVSVEQIGKGGGRSWVKGCFEAEGNTGNDRSFNAFACMRMDIDENGGWMHVE